MDQVYEILLKLSGADSLRNGMDITSVRLETWLPLWVLPFIFAIVACGVFFLYMREHGISRKKRIALAVARTLAYFALFSIISAPSVRVDGEGMPHGRIPIVIDNTLSMTIRDCEKETSRSTFAMSKLSSLTHVPEDIDDLETAAYLAGKDFRLIEQTKAGKPTETTPDGESTSLGTMLSKALDSNGLVSCPAMILLTDGADNSRGGLNNILREFKRRSVPVYILGTGSESFRDVAVRGINMDGILFIDEKYKADVRVMQKNLTGSKTGFHASIAGEDITPPPGELTLAKDGENVLELEFTPAKTGVYELKVSLDPLPGEASVENNTYIRNFRVIDKKIRILMAFGGPSWEYRYLAGAFSRDKRVAFKTFFMEPDSRRADVKTDSESEFIRELPKTAEDLNKNFDMVIMSGLDITSVEKEFTAALAKFVDEYSGGLVISADPTYIPYTMKGTPLEELLPITVPRIVGRSYADELDNPKTDPMTFVMTDEGSDNELLQFSGDRSENRAIWEKMPPVYNVYTDGRPKPGAVSILAAFKNGRRQIFPAIMLSTYGRGSVIFTAFDSTWRWRREFGNRFFRDYWCKVAQFSGLPHLLSESRLSEIFVSDENAHVSEKLTVTARVLDSALEPVSEDLVTLKIKTPSGAETELAVRAVEGRSGLYRGDFIPGEHGDYKISLEDKYKAKSLHVRVSPPRGEFINSELNTDLITYIVKETGGQIITAENADGIIKKIAAERIKDTMSRTFQLWDTPLMLIIALLLFCTEWIMRKLWSLD